MVKLAGDYLALRHERGKKNRFYIWCWRDGKVLKKWLKHNEVQMWLDLLKEE